MPRMIQIHPLSLAIGAVAVAAAFVLTAQSTAPAQTPWPPPKSMVLNVFEELSPPPMISPGGSYTVLTVPPDRWLTITGASVKGQVGGLRWAELSTSGGLTKKGAVDAGQFIDVCCGISQSGVPEGSPIACGGPLGWTFAPGSSVVILNPYLSAANVGTISLIGYYSRN